MKTYIRSLKPEDKKIAMALWTDSVKNTHQFVTEEHVSFFKFLLCITLDNALETFYGLFDKNEYMIGFMSVKDNELCVLFLWSRLIRCGYGRILLDYAINELGVNKVDVNEQNPNAVAFYEAFGFAVKSRSELDGCGCPYPILHMEIS